nr:NADH dehydrogenase subunit 2 [Abantennarius coccineus]
MMAALPTFFLLMMGLGTVITMVSTHWFMAWVGLEMNALAVLPIMIDKSNPRAVEATTKYFLIQATAALMILFAAAMNAEHTGSWNIQETMHPAISVLFTLALAMKLGLAPFHAWVPEVLQGLNLKAALILSTWQKLAPIFLLMQIDYFHAIVLMLAIVSIMIGAWGGLNQTQLRKLLAYSSIAYMGWLVIIIQYAPALALLNFTLYCFATAATFLILMFTSSTTIAGLASTSMKSQMLLAMTLMVLLSLGGLPPLSGFLIKLLTIDELMKQGLIVPTLLILPPALMSLYFYIRIAHATFFTMPPNNLTSKTVWRSPQSETPMPLAVCIILSLMLLPATPAFITLIL